MPVFDQICQSAQQAEEKKRISRELAERVCAIGQDRLHYKHLGLELHGLMARLAQSGGKGSDGSQTELEELVQQIEDKHRRL